MLFRLFPERFNVVIIAESISKHPCPSHLRPSHAISGRLFSEGLYRGEHPPRSPQIWTLTRCVNCTRCFCCRGYCRRSLLPKNESRLRSVSLSCDLQPKKKNLARGVCVRKQSVVCSTMSCRWCLFSTCEIIRNSNCRCCPLSFSTCCTPSTVQLCFVSRQARMPLSTAVSSGAGVGEQTL